MPLPPGAAYGDIGMSKCSYIFHFLYFCIIRTNIFFNGV
jgi:hypothetical protein